MGKEKSFAKVYQMKFKFKKKKKLYSETVFCLSLAVS